MKSGGASGSDTELLTAEEVARRLTISVKTLRGHVKDEALPRVIVGRGTTLKHYKFDPADVDAFIRNRKEFGASPSAPMPRKRGRKSATIAPAGQVFDFEARLREFKEREARHAGDSARQTQIESARAAKTRDDEFKAWRAERKRESAARSERFKAAKSKPPEG